MYVCPPQCDPRRYVYKIMLGAHLHAEDAEALAVAVPGGRGTTAARVATLAGLEGQCKSQRISRIDGLDDAVVPESCRGVECCGLLFDLILERRVFRRIPETKSAG